MTPFAIGEEKQQILSDSNVMDEYMVVAICVVDSSIHIRSTWKIDVCGEPCSACKALEMVNGLTFSVTFQLIQFMVSEKAELQSKAIKQSQKRRHYLCSVTDTAGMTAFVAPGIIPITNLVFRRK
ncbi:hypothetical protein OPV22_032974 [Ensete ventricosum]|uniref:Uncharacterized protein n=1 Tax=Ensete ventricosum TaxID=4639 RepID=A0AAV8PT38_ENSVE|nr:hypothetical protein OPV22_032974 [Ensete ventricosum]